MDEDCDLESGFDVKNQEIEQKHSGLYNLGYRDGHAAGIEASMQDGFNKGFACSMPLISRLAQMKGILQALSMKFMLSDGSSSSDDQGVTQVVLVLDAAASRLVTALQALNASDMKLFCDSYCVKRDTSSVISHAHDAVLDSFQQLRMDYANTDNDSIIAKQLGTSHCNSIESDISSVNTISSELLLNGDESPLSLCMFFCKLESYCLKLFKHLNLTSVYK